MRRILLTALMTTLLAFALLVLAPGSLVADDGEIPKPVPDLLFTFRIPRAAPDETEMARVTAGDRMTLSAFLIDPAGNPVYGQEIVFIATDKFMNVSGQLELGRARTDGSGLAELPIIPRREGETLVTASFAGNDVFAAVEASESLEVAGGEQLYEEHVPFRIPGANVWMVTAILGSLWGIYFIAMGYGVHIARSGDSR